MFALSRFAVLSCLSLCAMSTTLGGCAVETEEESDADESALTKGLAAGKFQSQLTSASRLKPGYLYRIDIGKKQGDYQYATVYLVSDLCAKQRADKTCDKSFIEKNPKSLNRYWNDIHVSTATKSFTFDYEKPDAREGFITQTLSWSYKGTTSNKLSLTPKGATSGFAMSRMPALPRIDANVKKTFETWMDELQGDTSTDVDDAPAVRIEDLPLEAQRIAHYFDAEYSGDYATDAHKITVKGTQYYALNQGSDGGGHIHFFTLRGAYLGDYGGSESSAWDFTWNE